MQPLKLFSAKPINYTIVFNDSICKKKLALPISPNNSNPQLVFIGPSNILIQPFHKLGPWPVPPVSALLLSINKRDFNDGLVERINWDKSDLWSVKTTESHPYSNYLLRSPRTTNFQWVSQFRHLICSAWEGSRSLAKFLFFLHRPEPWRIKNKFWMSNSRQIPNILCYLLWTSYPN